MNPDTKSIFASKGVISGFAITALFAALGLFGIHLDKAVALGFVDGAMKLWPVIVGVASGIVAIYFRIRQTNFHTLNWRNVFVAFGALTSTVATNYRDIQHVGMASLDLLASMGVDVHDMQYVVAGANEIAAKTPGLALSGLLLYSAVFARKKTVVRRAEPV